jgi:hypothetical protein
MSFLLDPPLLVASGAVAERALGDDPQAVGRVRAVSVAAFVGVSAGLYANVGPLADRWPLLGARSGREFMLTSGLAQVDESSIGPGRHVAALSLFALYPLWFRLGQALVRGSRG